MKPPTLILLTAFILVAATTGVLLARNMMQGESVNNAAASGGKYSDRFSTFITDNNISTGPPRVAAEIVSPLGAAVDVSCAACHANFTPNFERRSGEDLVDFHQGLRFAHGTNSCLTCHNSQNYNTLRLADGSAIGFDQVITLCSQCHTPQARDYAAGAHGGMNGYWDATRGPQIRKICIDCHDPHAPAFPAMKPTFKPHDRFLSPAHKATGVDNEH